MLHSTLSPNIGPFIERYTALSQNSRGTARRHGQPERTDRQDLMVLRVQLRLALRERERLAVALRESEARYNRLLEDKEQERSHAAAAEANLRAILAASPQPIIVLDPEGYVKSWNAAAERTLGWSEEEIMDRGLPTIPEWEQKAANAVFYRLLAGETIVDMDVRRRRKDGSWIDLSVSAAPLLDGEGRVSRIVEVYADISERKRTERTLARMALHDPLTDLPNRVLLQERVSQAIATCQEDGSTFVLFLLVLDGFKEVNDTHGHEWGDRLLQEVGRRLQSAVRDTDTVARLGGDEFAIMFAPAEKDARPLLAEKVQRVVEEPLALEGRHVRVKASLGSAIFPRDGTDTRTLLRAADVAMYRAKRRGREWVEGAQEPDVA